MEIDNHIARVANTTENEVDQLARINEDSMMLILEE
jgi:hypothetical protein